MLTRAVHWIHPSLEPHLTYLEGLGHQISRIQTASARLDGLEQSMALRGQGIKHEREAGIGAEGRGPPADSPS